MAGKQEKLSLGNMNAKRDWGFAGDYVKGMWMMLQQDKPDDYVVATGETRTVRDFAKIAFEKAGMAVEFTGTGVDEIGTDKKTGKVVVKVNPKFFRPAEVELLIGNPKKAEEKLGWKREITFDQMVERMIATDMALVKQELKYAANS